MAENEKKDLEKVEKVKSDKPSVWSTIGAWFKSLKSECKKIAWASFKSIKANTAIVLVVAIVFAIVLGLLDYLFQGGLNGLNGLVTLIKG